MRATPLASRAERGAARMDRKTTPQVEPDRKMIRLVMQAMGRKGAKAGAAKAGRARMAALTPAERTALARKAATTRWQGKEE